MSDANGNLDIYPQKVGIRSVGWNSTTLTINGVPVYLRGVGKHEDADVSGVCVCAGLCVCVYVCVGRVGCYGGVRYEWRDTWQFWVCEWRDSVWRVFSQVCVNV